MCTFAGEVVKNTLDTSVSHTCSQKDVMTTAKRTFLEDTVLAASRDFFNRALSVESVVGNLILPQAGDGFCVTADFMCCGKNQPSQSYTTGYPDTDFVLYVTGRPTGGSTIAWATTCMNAAGSYRPVSGHANFGPALINDDVQQQVSTAIHEIAHALGFSNSMFTYFRVPGTTTARGRSNVISSFSERGGTVSKIITEEVIAKARDHFDCAGLNGGELENAGGSGSASSHWEKRVYMNEIMSATLNSHLPTVISTLTLALFQDSGWYTVDYTAAESYAWGNGQGCSFAMDQCNTWHESYFCQTRHEQGCFPNHFYKGKCSLIDYFELTGQQLPSKYQYFPSAPTNGGYDEFPDYCPLYVVGQNSDCRDPNVGDIQAISLGESPGPSSRCFVGTFHRADAHDSWHTHHSGCMRTECNGLSGAVEVQFLRADGKPTQYYSVTCPKTGTDAERTVDLAAATGGEFAGTIVCPEASSICTNNPCDTNTCNGHGTCQEAKDGECDCTLGFYGADLYSCDLRRCPYGRNATNSSVECSGHGSCQSDVFAANSGVCTCDAGYRGDACQELGCPFGPDTGVGEKQECDGKGTCDTNTGVCQCNPGQLPPNCHLTQCPMNATNVTCSAHGTCDQNNGWCECNQVFELQADGSTKMVRYYSGRDCSVELQGDAGKSLYFSGEEVPPQFNVTNLAPGTRQAEPLALELNGEEYQYFSFLVESVQYQVTITLSWDTKKYPAANPYITACYASECQRPTKEVAQFFATQSDNDKALGRKPIVLVPDDSAGQVNAAFDHVGEMRLAVISQDTMNATLTIERDPCSYLQCVHGNCVNKKCACDPPPNIYEWGTWAGSLCDIMNCPGTPPCNGQGGTCVLDADAGFPVCACSAGFSGAKCNILAQGFSNINNPSHAELAGTLEIGQNKTYVFNVNATQGIMVRLQSANPGADPILLGQVGKVPPLVPEATTQFDRMAWIQGLSTHMLSFTASTSGFCFVQVLNGRYATDRLEYSLVVEAVSGCPAALGNCSDHGSCASGVCQCENGYEGQRCESRVPQVNSTQPVVVEALAIGEWRYFMYESTAAAKEVKFELVHSRSTRRSQALMTVGVTSQRRANNLRVLTGEAAMFDYGGYTSKAMAQELVVRREGHSFFFIGVHNSGHSVAPVTVSLTATEYSAVQFDGTGCDANAAATANCSARLCHGHGAYTTDEGVPICLCESGWVSDTMCNTPRFTSFASLLSAAQDVGFLCNLCNFEIPLAQNALRVYKIPQPLQKQTGLHIVASTVNGTSAFGNPSLLVSSILPRSITDFTFVSSSSSSNESLTLYEQSPTGRYWLVVYGNTAATYQVEASRETTPGEELFAEGFLESLWDWVSGTTLGAATAAVAGGVIILMCVGCCMQVCRGGIKKTAEQLRENVADVGACCGWVSVVVICTRLWW